VALNHATTICAGLSAVAMIATAFGVLETQSSISVACTNHRSNDERSEGRTPCSWDFAKHASGACIRT